MFYPAAWKAFPKAAESMLLDELANDVDLGVPYLEAS
jgi:hypothetical protein